MALTLTTSFSQAFAPGRIAAPLLGLALAASACDAHPHGTAPSKASPLGVVSTATPRFPVARFATGGTYPQFRHGTVRSAGRQPSSPRRDPQGSTWLRAVRPALCQARGGPATSLPIRRLLPD